MPSTNAEILLETLTRFLGAESLGPVGVGYSGGRDSAVLLWCLVQVLGADRVTAVHIDHGWRPEVERGDEKALVRAYCQSLGTALAEKGPPALSQRTEVSARAYRYRCFQEFLGSQPGGVVFLAHHADDQAETILMRLLKGRSWQGLAGMAPRRGPFRRPFLEVPSEVLARAAEELSLSYHTDSTNNDLSLTRNFLRSRILPAVKSRFPRAAGALADFGRVWGQASLLQEPHPSWVYDGRTYRIAPELWSGWSSLERQAQLLALVNRVEPAFQPTRRFLETVTAKTSGDRGQGAGWRWSWGPHAVSWAPVAPEAGKEYFIHAVPGRTFDLGWYRFRWDQAPGGLLVPGIDPSRPWFWRSPVPGMRYTSADHPDWGRDLRKKRFGTCPSEAAALVLQDGLLRAVVDPRGNRIVWSESGVEKLHKPGIFVTLVTVTPISTE